MISPRRIAARLRDAISPGAVILLYHRVADLDFDPQKLAVSRANFAAHLDVLRQTATTVPLRELQSTIRGKGKARGLAAITFDDGYADNLLHAKPEFEKRGIPATVFVASGYCEKGKEFWWDELERIFLTPGSLPPTLTLTIDGRAFTRTIDPVRYERSAFDAHRSWDVESPANPTPRHALYRELHRLLKTGSVERREHAMQTIRDWASSPYAARDTHRPMTPAEVRALSSGGTVAVGAHTVSHPRLSELDRIGQRLEIHHSREDLENFTGESVTTFAYPYGGTADYNRDSVKLASEVYELACSNFRGTVHAGTSPFQLPRVLVRNWTADEFRTRIVPLLAP